MKPTAIIFEKNVPVDIKQTVVIKLLAACKSLDVIKLQELIEDNEMFVTDGKNEFLTNLKDIFSKCTSEGLKELKQYHAVCRLCFSKTIIAGFKDITEKGRLGLYFQPMISNPNCIYICTRFTSTDGVYDKDVHFAPPNLTESEWKDHAGIIDTGIIPEHMKKPKSLL